MATFDFNLTAVKLVESSLRVAGALEEEEPVEPVALQNGIEAANTLIKHWTAQGAHLWKKTEGVLFLNSDQKRYLLGPTGDRTAEENDFIETRMDGAQLSAATSITVVDTTGMAAADTIGIFIDISTRFWTTIVSVDTATTLTITGALPSDTLDRATVFTFTNFIERPLRILHGRRRAGGPEVGEIPTFPLSRGYYFDLTTRDSAKGLPVEHHYEPIIEVVNGRRNGELFLWPVPNNVDYLFKFTFAKPFEDIDTNSDLTDFPVEWLRALKFNIAEDLMHEYRVPATERQFIIDKAESTLETAFNFDRENAPTRIMPDLRGHG